MRIWFSLSSILVTLFIFFLAEIISPNFYIAFYFFGPLILLGFVDMFSTKHTIIRNYPIVGRFRYVMEELRPKIYQYFVESDTDGAPLNRMQRSMVYQRAKKVNDTVPFGTPFDVNQVGYEWINHSMFPLGMPTKIEDLRVSVGGKDCLKPYSLSIFNISAMSYGALSQTAIKSLNKGAQIGGFAHNTGEGGISPHHLKYGGDLIWQIGTGYFGCRDQDGNFSVELFKEEATREEVKMIEIKLSQGAKPGHGGILPGAKNTAEIAAVRKVAPGTTVLSPPGHTAFSNSSELVDFINTLRNASGGKPVGIKLCLGEVDEFENVLRACIEKGCSPDYIVVDGGEGGTGSAPPEFSSSIGQSLNDGLVAVSNLLINYGLKEEIKILCSGKVISGFDIIKAISMGADACYSARGMMLALGCIQALQCHTNKCPTGVATQNPASYRGLSITEKHKRVRNYHHATLHSVSEILAAAGLSSPKQLNRSHIWRRISVNESKNFEQLFPYPTQELKERILESIKEPLNS